MTDVKIGKVALPLRQIRLWVTGLRTTLYTDDPISEGIPNRIKLGFICEDKADRSQQLAQHTMPLNTGEKDVSRNGSVRTSENFSLHQKEQGH